jgi:hypothetical protein
MSDDFKDDLSAEREEIAAGEFFSAQDAATVLDFEPTALQNLLARYTLPCRVMHIGARNFRAFTEEHLIQLAAFVSMLNAGINPKLAAARLAGIDEAIRAEVCDPKGGELRGWYFKGLTAGPTPIWSSDSPEKMLTILLDGASFCLNPSHSRNAVRKGIAYLRSKR